MKLKIFKINTANIFLKFFNFKMFAHSELNIQQKDDNFCLQWKILSF